MLVVHVYKCAYMNMQLVSYNYMHGLEAIMDLFTYI